MRVRIIAVTAFVLFSLHSLASDESIGRVRCDVTFYSSEPPGLPESYHEGSFSFVWELRSDYTYRCFASDCRGNPYSDLESSVSITDEEFSSWYEAPDEEFFVSINRFTGEVSASIRWPDDRDWMRYEGSCEKVAEQDRAF